MLSHEVPPDATGRVVFKLIGRYPCMPVPSAPGAQAAAPHHPIERD